MSTGRQDAKESLFTGLCICTTGLAVHVKEQVRKIVLACDGAFEDDLTLDATTHLVADAVGSHKHRAAVTRGLPVVSSRWIFDSFRAHALLEASLYALRTIEGLVVCTTGLSAQTRVQIETLATIHGAVYDPSLEVGRTDVLIAQAPTGPKYETAVAHGIPVVHVSWIHACIEKGTLADEAAFSLENLVAQPQQLVQHLRQALDDVTGAKLQSLLTLYWQQQAQNDEPEEWLELFDACGFFLVGFPADLESKITHLIRTGMGTIYYEMQVPAVSHVIVSPVLSDMGVLERLEQLVVAANASAMVHFVSAKWIIDSLKCLRLEPEEMYPVEIEDPMEEAAPPAPLLDRLTSFASSVGGLADVSMELPEEEDENGHDQDTSAIRDGQKKTKMLKDYGFLLVCVDPDEPKLVRSTVKELQKRGGAQVVALDHRDFEHVDPAQFDFVTHIVIGSGVALDPELAEIVRKKFAALYQNQCPGTPKSKRVRYVSDLWVRCCLAADSVLSHQSHELFTLTYHEPRSFFPKALPLACFKRVVASTSVYVGVDRVVVMELLRMAGAHVSPKLSKKNTHLICLNAIGMKYEKAREWGLTIVTARWVIQSVLAGTLLDPSLPEFQVVDEDMTAHADTSSSTSGSRTTLGSMDPARRASLHGDTSSSGSGNRTTLGSMDPARTEVANQHGTLSQEWTSRRTSGSL